VQSHYHAGLREALAVAVARWKLAGSWLEAGGPGPTESDTPRRNAVPHAAQKGSLVPKAPRDLAPAGSAPAGKPRSLWRNRDYLLLWSGQVVSVVGTGASQLAYPLLVLARTGSAAQAGVVGALRGATFVLLALPAGALVDRWNRKTVMLVCDGGRALLLGSVALALMTGHLTLAQLYLTATVEGILFTFVNLAEAAAALPQVAAPEQIATAAVQNEASLNVTVLIALLLGGLLYSVRAGLPFLADAISYGVSVGSWGLIRKRFPCDRPQTTASPRRIWADIGEGLRWLWRERLIRYLALLAGCINAALLGAELLVIVLAQGQHASPAVIGALFAVGGVGSILGALLSAPWQRFLPFERLVPAT
jgi:hypothetical protein